MIDPAVCLDAPDFQHHVAGDHHGDDFTCTWCGEEVVQGSGRLVLKEAS